MIKHSAVRTLFLSSIIVLAIIIAAFFAIANPTHAAPATSPGQSNISQTIGKLAHFSPKTLACTRPAGQTCSISIKNTTSTTESVTLKGSVVYTLKPKQVQSISYKTAGTYVYALSSNSKATLTVTVS